MKMPPQIIRLVLFSPPFIILTTLVKLLLSERLPSGGHALHPAGDARGAL